jgi:hypothetical protein
LAVVASPGQDRPRGFRLAQDNGKERLCAMTVDTPVEANTLKDRTRA